MKKLYFAAVMAVFVLAGCSAQAVAPAAIDNPVIKSFSAEPPTIASGESTQISWLVTNAKQVVIDNGIGAVALSGSFVVKPTGDATYKMTATNEAGAVNAVVTVRSHSPGSMSTPAQPLVQGKPVITDFYATPASIPSGNRTTLSWAVTGADSVTIDRGIGPVKPVGMKNVKPTEDTQYTLTAVNKAGTVTASVNVVVDTPDGLPVVRIFMADPGTITMGKSSLLNWDVADADFVRISNIGNVMAKGAIKVFPTSTIDYTLTASNPCGSVQTTCQIVVNEE